MRDLSPVCTIRPDAEELGDAGGIRSRKQKLRSRREPLDIAGTRLRDGIAAMGERIIDDNSCVVDIHERPAVRGPVQQRVRFNLIDPGYSECGSIQQVDHVANADESDSPAVRRPIRNGKFRTKPLCKLKIKTVLRPVQPNVERSAAVRRVGNPPLTVIIRNSLHG
ncbi:hypothetical protein D3C75_669340 [compost metagenome]